MPRRDGNTVKKPVKKAQPTKTVPEKPAQPTKTQPQRRSGK